MPFLYFRTTMKRKALLALCLILLSGKASAGQFEFNAQMQQAYNHIIALRFDPGREIIQVEKEQNPENVFPIILENYIDFLHVFITEEKDLFDKLSVHKAQRLKNIEKADAHSPFYHWSRAMIHLQWAFARLKFGESFTAAIELRRAFLLLERNIQTYPDFLQNEVGMGLLQALVGSIPPNYQWLVRLASMHGTVAQGRERLYAVLEQTQTHAQYRHLNHESLFFLSFIEMNLMANNTGLDRLLPYFEQVESDNLLMHYAYANLLMRAGRNESATNLLEKRPHGELYFPFYYLDYLLAEAKLRKLETDVAAQYYKIFLDEFMGINYKADAIRKLGWIALIHGDHTAYLNYMQQLKHFDAGTVGADHQAIREATLAQPPNIVLLRAQLLFDGGYYDAALQELENFRFDNELEGLTYHYRLGRIYHESGNTAMAIRFYRQTIELGANKPEYFAANAALKLGELFEQLGHLDAARQYYAECLNMKPDEYRSSIHGKAKAGLGRLE